MRTVLIGFFLLLFGILSIPLFLMEYLIGFFNLDARTRIAQGIMTTLAKFILWLGGISVMAIGLESVPKNQAVVYVFNHRSYFDGLICYATVPNLAGFIAMKEVKEVPILSTWMNFLQCLFLDTGNPRQALETIRQGIGLLASGHSIFIAPEGTLSRTGEVDMLPFKRGSFRLAEKSGCPIIPVAINNADQIFERQRPWVRPATVSIEYGNPIVFGDLTAEEQNNIHLYVQGIIQGMLEKNQRSFLNH